jgi:CRP-like cAMP-binding protein
VQYDLIFVVDGIVRNYYKKDNLEWTSKFLKAGDFVLSIDNFLFDLPCGEYIETCTPVEVIMFSKGDYEELLMQYPELNVVAKKIGDRRLRENNSRMYNWRMLSSAERYNQFVQQNPDLVKYVQLQHIASYLDISPYNLSRIRSSFKSMSGELGNSIKRTF